jgi:hypothetical protein
VRRLIGIMGLQTIYKEPNTSKKHPQHKIWPYLLKKLSIPRSNHVWCNDIIYIPVKNRLPVSVGNHGLGNTQSAVLAAIKNGPF